ncbi:unnamed protein product [marine sediment metagenome]|uniref:ArsR family transcriptional regulator n=1 Tax=marine sediment metagenome TaxID=412755 RepID=X1HB45_9ZZZZ
MKKQEIEVMSEKEERLVDVLQRLEFGRGTAKTLVYMLVRKTAARSKDIERAVDLGQPEVSVGTMELRNLGILSKRDAPKKGKGRPKHLYILNKSVPEVRDFLIKRAQEKIEENERDLELLKTLIGEKRNGTTK